MKAILIRVAIMLFIKWLRENKDIPESADGWLSCIFKANSHQGLIDALEHKKAEEFIEGVVADIENVTVSNIVNDMIGK